MDTSKASETLPTFIASQYDEVKDWKSHISTFSQLFFGALLGYTVSNLSPKVIEFTGSPLGIFLIVLVNLQFMIARPKYRVNLSYYIMHIMVLAIFITIVITTSVSIINSIWPKEKPCPVILPDGTLCHRQSL